MPAYALLTFIDGMMLVGSLSLSRFFWSLDFKTFNLQQCIKEQHICFLTDKLLSVLVKIACKSHTTGRSQMPKQSANHNRRQGTEQKHAPPNSLTRSLCCVKRSCFCCRDLAFVSFSCLSTHVLYRRCMCNLWMEMKRVSIMICAAMVK